MKNALRKLKRYIKILSCYRYDAIRFIKSTHYLETGQQTPKSKLVGRILAHAHCVEKGLALSQPRLGFGQPMITNLIRLLEEYKNYRMDPSAVCCSMGVGAIQAYVSFHDNCPEKIAEVLAALESADLPLASARGGTVERTADQMLEARSLPFDKLASCRHSVRNYSSKPVDTELILKAVELAQKSPSVCNRQGGRVHVIQDPDLKRKVLTYQNGNRGFGDSASAVLVVTVDLAIFQGHSERNQAFVDGGMFAMSLVYALTHLGIASCCLNWSAELKNDRGFRSLGIVPENEAIMMFVSVGHYPDQFKVAVSPRHPTSEIATIHE